MTRAAAKGEPARTAKAEATRTRLIEVAKRLARQKGADRVTLRDIAAAAKMKAGSIYYHFDSRDEIIRAVLDDAIQRARSAVNEAIAGLGPDSSPLDRLRVALRAHLRYVVQEHFSSRMQSIRRQPRRLRDHHMAQERDYAGIFTELLREAEAAGMVLPGRDLSIVRMLAMGALTWVGEWFDPAGALTLDDIADELVAILSRGAAPVRAPRRAKGRDRANRSTRLQVADGSQAQ